MLLLRCLIAFGCGGERSLSSSESLNPPLSPNQGQIDTLAICKPGSATGPPEPVDFLGYQEVVVPISGLSCFGSLPVMSVASGSHEVYVCYDHVDLLVEGTDVAVSAHYTLQSGAVVEADVIGGDGFVVSVTFEIEGPAVLRAPVETDRWRAVYDVTVSRPGPDDDVDCPLPTPPVSEWEKPTDSDIS